MNTTTLTPVSALTRHLRLLSFCASALLFGAGATLGAQTTYKYANPIGWGGDPTVTFNDDDGFYYGSITGNVYANDPGATNAAILLYRAKTLGGLFSSDPIFVPLATPAVGPNDAIWAPDIRFFNGHAHIYYHDHTKSTVRVAISDTTDAFGSYTDQAVSFPGSWTGGKGYDWTVFQRKDGSYWAFFARASGLFVAAMSSPTAVLRDAVEISHVAASGWERTDNEGDGCNEAPQVIAFPDLVNPNKERIFVTYSANTWRRDDYSLGMLTFNGNNGTALDAANVSANWTKHTDGSGTPAPVFSKGNNIVSTGSNAMTKGPDGTWWNVYGARYYTYVKQDRELRAQKIDITSGEPDFGQPVKEGKLFSLPEATAYPISFIIPAGTYDDSDPKVFYSDSRPPWTDEALTGALNGSIKYSAVDRAIVEFKVVALTASIKAPKGPLYGTAEVYVDGNYDSDINLYAATNSAPVTVFSKTFSTSAQHTILLVNVHDKASPAITDPRIGVDSITTTR